MTAPEFAGALLSLLFCIWCVLLHLLVFTPPVTAAHVVHHMAPDNAEAGLNTSYSPEPSCEHPSNRQAPKARQLRGSHVKCCRYFAEKHWLANNVLGLAFSVQGIEHLSLGAVSTGVILLSGLFFYDIFWVFCTPVMVSVVRSPVCVYVCECSLVLGFPQPVPAVCVLCLLHCMCLRHGQLGRFP